MSLARGDPELFFHSHHVLYEGTGIGVVPVVPTQSMTWAEGDSTDLNVQGATLVATD